SSPMKSARVSGPMGCAIPSLKTSSTASGVATPSITAYMASFSSGMSTRLETNPGASFTSTGVFSSFSARAFAVAKVSSDVASPRINSTSFIIGTGLKKCIPITLSGRLVAAASLVIEMDEVLDERTTSGRHIALLRRQLVLRNLAFQVLADGLKSSIDEALRDVNQHDVVSALREHVSD